MMRAGLRRLVSVLVALLVTGGGLITVAPTASADVTYVPDRWNGKVVYLSQACHDRGDTVCHTNTGCDGFSENANSYFLAVSAAREPNRNRLSLLERGYKVVRGNGLTRQNIARSNRAGADVHVPLHSNAISSSCESGRSAARYGTRALYLSNAGGRCAARLVARVGAVSPGTSDSRQYRTDLGELNQTNAVACYLEQEFHVWQKGVNFMRARGAWSYRIGAGLDQFMGYP